MPANRPDFEILETLQESERFLVQKVAADGLTSVLKQAKTPQMAENLIREREAYDIYGSFTRLEGCPFTTATILEGGEDWLLLSWLDGRPMSELITPTSKRGYYEKIANIMAFCDSAQDENSSVPLPAETLALHRVRMQEIRQSFGQLSAYGAGTLQPRLEAATELYLTQASNLKTRFVNDDLTPAHIMVQDDAYALFDFESVKLHGPRFADVINLATKLWFLEGDEAEARNFFAAFWQQRGIDPGPHRVQLRTLVGLRCAAFCNELLTEPDQHHNTTESMTPDYAQNIAAVLDWAKTL